MTIVAVQSRGELWSKQNKKITRKVITMRKHALLVFSLAFLGIGILGLIGVGFFHSNSVLEIVQIVLGGVGLLLVFGRLK